MEDEKRTKKELIIELAAMRQRITELEKSGVERKQSTDYQGQTEEIYRCIFENAPIGIFVGTPDGRYFNANPALARIYGFDSSEELLTTVNDIKDQIYVYPEERSRMLHLFQQNNAIENFETQQYRKDGSKIWTSSNVRAARGPDGKILHYEGTVQDITHRRCTEEALKESEERYRTLIENSNDAVAIVKEEFHVYVNRKFVEMFGYTNASEILGQTNSMIVHPDDFSMVNDFNLRRQKGEPVPQRYEFKGIKKDGKPIYLEVSAANIVYQGDSASLVYLRDVSKRVMFEETIRAKNQQLYDIIEFLPDPTFVIDQNKKVIAWNRALEEMTGVRKEDILGRNDYAYAVPFYGEKRPILIDLILKPNQTSEKLYDFVLRKGDVLYGEGFVPAVYNGKGAYFWATAAPLFDNTGNVTGAIESVRDITDQKNTVKALQVSEERWKFALEGAGDGVWDWDVQTNTVFYSKKWKSRLGFAGHEIGDTFDEWGQLIHPDDRAYVYDEVKKHFESKVPIYTSEHRLKCKDGTYKWILDRGKIMSRTPEGKPLRVIGTHTDITERKRAEKALQESEHKFRDLSEKSIAGIYVLQEDGLVKYVNARCAEIFEYKVEEVIDTLRIEDVIFPEDWPFVRESVRRRMSGELFSCHYEFRIVTKNKDVKYVEVYGSMTIYEGKPAIIGTLLDITIRKEAQKALIERENKYRELVDQLPETLWEFDENGTYTFINLHGLQNFGYTTEDLNKGRNIFHTLAPEDHERARTNLQKRNRGEQLGHNEYTMVRKDGTRFPVLIHTKRIARDGKPARFRSVVVDITEQRCAEEALRESEERYRTIFENAVLGIFQTSPDGRFIRINAAFALMHGYGSPEEMISSITDITRQCYVNPDDRARLGRLLETHSTGRFEAQYYRKDRSKIWLLMNVRAVTGPDGKILCYEGTVEDVTERKQAEKMLQESERKFRDLSEKSIAGIYVLQEDGLVKYVNARCAEIFGYTLEEVIDILRVEDVIFPEDWPIVRESVSRRISGELPSDNYEFRIVRKNNDIRYVETYSSITVYEGKPAILGTLLDITERKQAESKLHEKELMLAESNRMLQLVLDTVPVGIFWKDRDSVYRGCNRRFAIDGGHESPAEIVGKTDYDLPWYEHAETFRKDDENVILSSKPKINHEETLTKSDGSQIWVCTSKVPLCDVENRVIGVLGTIEDITESKDALEELRKSEKRFRELVDLLPQTVVEVNEKGCVTFINDYGKEKYGFAQEDISQGIEIIKRVIPEEHERAEVEMERVLNGERIEGSEFTTLRNDGSALPALIYASPVRRVDGHHGGLVVSIDITERKNLESQLMQAQKMESIGTLAGGIAHDFNNLLTTILGCGQLLKMKGGLDVRSDNYVDRIIEAAEGAAQLTQNILAFSRKQPTKAAVVDVNMIVKKVEKMALRLVEENIELEVLLSKDDLNIVADTSQLEQILMNLIVNARDAMPDGGRLTIQAEQVKWDQEFIERHGGGGKPGRYAKIVVADNGIGMPRKTVDRIFEPFFTTKEVGKGTGLGLSITHGIVRKHDGYITVSSAPGKGTTFEVYIPLTDTAGDAQIATPAEVRLQKGNETLLVAEDDPFTRNMLKTILEEGGYGIIEAVDGEDALQKYVQHKERIEMIILDVIMPKMNGNAVYDAIKVMDPFQRILFISGYTPDEISRSGIFQENPNLIKKPFLPDVLLTKIREVFAR